MLSRTNYLYFGQRGVAPSHGVLTVAFVVDKAAKKVYCGFSMTPRRVRFYKSFARLVADLRLSFAVTGRFDTASCEVALQRVKSYVTKSSTRTRIPTAMRADLLVSSRSVGYYNYDIAHFTPLDLADIRYQACLDLEDTPDFVDVRFAVLKYVMYGDHQMAMGIRSFLYNGLRRALSGTKGEQQDPAQLVTWLDAQQELSRI